MEINRQPPKGDDCSPTKQSSLLFQPGIRYAAVVISNQNADSVHVSTVTGDGPRWKSQECPIDYDNSSARHWSAIRAERRHRRWFLQNGSFIVTLEYIVMFYRLARWNLSVIEKCVDCKIILYYCKCKTVLVSVYRLVFFRTKLQAWSDLHSNPSYGL